MACIDPRKDPKAFVGNNSFPHFISGKCYMTAQEFLAEFDKPAEDPEEDGTDEAKELRAKLKTAGVTGWGPRTKLEDLRKLAEGI
jgi:hypothetical protein